MTRPDAPGGTDGTGWATAMTAMMVVAPVVILLALVVIAARILDVRRRRDDEAAVLQSRVSDLLMQDHTLGRIPVTVTAHAPLRRSAPFDVTVVGVAPTFAIGDAVHRVVERELNRSGVSYRLDDHITVDEHVHA